jgi:hypothetical protein
LIRAAPEWFPPRCLSLGSRGEFGSERFSAHGVIYSGGTTEWRDGMPARPLKLPSDGVMADVCLGVTVTSLYTLVGMGLVIAFM